MSSQDELNSVRVNQILKGDSFPNDDESTFMDSNIAAFFDDLLSKTNQTKGDIIRDANIPRTYGYQILNGSRIAHRDYYLCIAIAMKLDLRTTQRLLAVTQAGGLHSLIKRDAAIIFAINHGYSNIEAYDFMRELGLEPLEKDCDESDPDDQ